jgi:YidC/Oxa1 family membrane protein insertase
MLDPLYTAVSWVLLRWHSLFTAIGLPSDGGLNWALSIIFLVVTARVLLFRFFIKQVHYQRKMQELQPQIKKLQVKHKGDKATLQKEMMALQQAEGFNPISGCLPMLFQFPIFIALFHVLKHMSAAVSSSYPEKKLTLYGFTRTQTLDAAHAKLFRAPLAASLRESAHKVTVELGGSLSATRIVIIVLVIISAGATLITQRAVMNNATTPPEGQAATIQRLMLFGIPASVVFSGLIFPIGVLLYWFTSNLWTMGQQFYILRFHPHVPAGTAAAAGAGTSAPTKAVGPKVGQRPTRDPRSGRPTGPKTTPAKPVNPGTDGSKSNGSKTNGSTTNGSTNGSKPDLTKRDQGKPDLTKRDPLKPDPLKPDSADGEGNEPPDVTPPASNGAEPGTKRAVSKPVVRSRAANQRPQRAPSKKRR